MSSGAILSEISTDAAEIGRFPNRYLLDEGADVDLRDRRTHETPLHKAARAGATAAAKALVARGASIVARDAVSGKARDFGAFWWSKGFLRYQVV